MKKLLVFSLFRKKGIFQYWFFFAKFFNQNYDAELNNTLSKQSFKYKQNLFATGPLSLQISRETGFRKNCGVKVNAVKTPSHSVWIQTRLFPVQGETRWP